VDTNTKRASEVIAASVLSVLFCGWMWNNDRVFHSLLAGAFVAVPFIVWLAYARRSRKRRQTSPQWNTGRTDLPPRARQCRRPGDHLKGLFQQKYECSYQNTTLEGTCKSAISGLIHYYSRANPSTKPRSNRDAGRLGRCCRNGPPYFHACVFGSGRHVIWPLATAGAVVCCP
jgi:hypothetical protein